MIEQWRDIVGYEGYYQVSNLGHVRRRGKILQPFPNDKYGYLAITLHAKGKRQTVRIHKLVANAWIGLCPKNQQIRHGVNGKLDNAVSNLCYGTASEGHYDKRRDGTHGGKSVQRSDGVEFINMHVAAEVTGCASTHISCVCRGKRKTAGGFGWKYSEVRVKA